MVHVNEALDIEEVVHNAIMLIDHLYVSLQEYFDLIKHIIVTFKKKKQ